MNDIDNFKVGTIFGAKEVTARKDANVNKDIQVTLNEGIADISLDLSKANFLRKKDGKATLIYNVAYEAPKSSNGFNFDNLAKVVDPATGQLVHLVKGTISFDILDEQSRKQLASKQAANELKLCKNQFNKLSQSDRIDFINGLPQIRLRGKDISNNIFDFPVSTGTGENETKFNNFREYAEFIIKRDDAKLTKKKENENKKKLSLSLKKLSKVNLEELLNTGNVDELSSAIALALLETETEPSDETK